MRTKRIFSVLLALLSVLLLFTVSASALTWDGSSAGGSTSAVNGSSTGYVIRSTNDDYCVVGYRFSVVNSAGTLKVNKVIDVYRNTTNGDNAYSTSAKFSTKYNKKQLIANKNATLTTTYNTTNCYKEKDMGFVSKLPNPDGVETWQKYETNINKVLTKIGVGTTANMVYGDKVIIEPLFDVCLAGEYQALTVTEIAYCGRSVKGGSSDGGVSNGTSSTWGFISNYTNYIWPNKLYTPNGQGLWTAATALGSKTTFDNIMTKGYGAGIAYSETTKIEYTIKFDGNGSTSGSTASMSMIYGTAKNLTANGFKRTGYQFTGWNTKANGNGTKYSDKQSVNNLSSTNGATVTLYAQWTPNVLTVMYDCYGSSVSIDKSKGYFLGTYNRLCSTSQQNKELWGTKNVYYATYKYNDNIGTNGLHDFATFGLTAPAGYKFAGWSCNGKTFDETTTTYKPTDFTDDIKTGDAEVWLSAQFTKITYTVSYNANGGSGAPDNQTKTHGVDLTLSTTKPTRTGYTFSGWNTNASGTGTNYASGGKYTGNANLTLYAKWQINTYTVSYNANGGTGAPGNQTKTYGVDLTLSSTKPTRTGYTFGGWNTNASGTGTNYASGGKYAGNANLTLYAKWTPISYSVKFNGNGSTSGSMSNQSHTYDTAKALTANAFKRAFVVTYNYNGNGKSNTTATATATFGGWATSASGSKVYNDKQSVKNLSSTAGATVNLYAKWTDASVTLPTPTRNGYTFSGWYTSASGGTKIGAGGASYKPTANITLYAHWSPISYSVKFNGNGSTSGSMANQSFTYDVAQNLSANAFKRSFIVTYNYNGSGAKDSSANANATFNGWATSSTGKVAYSDKQSVKNLSSSAGATINLYANWTDASVTLPTPTRTGYTFSGWYTSASGGTKIGTGCAKYTPTKNITLYAQWSPITYTIKFVGNGSTSGSMANMSMTYDVAKNLTDNAFKRTGYSFTGWNTKADGSGTKYTNKQSVKNLTTINGATITLYAQWTPDSYTIKFNGNGSTSGTMSDLKMTYDVAKDLTANAYKRTGYTFKNWNTKTDGTGTSYADKQSVKNLSVSSGTTITLYAQWTPISYSIKFNGNGATSGTMANLAMTYDVTKNLMENAFKKTGYVFSGWATTATGKATYSDKQSVKNLTTTNGATINLYAVWTPITYTVKFNGNNSTSGTMSNLSMTYDTAKTLTANAFKRTGYTFGGWNTAANGSGTKYTDKQSVKNLTTTQGATVNLYAQWTSISYSVKFNGNGSTSGSMSNQSFVYDKAQNLTANAFKREFTITYNYNYTGKTNTTEKAAATFNGWATSAGGSVAYTDKQSVKNLSSTSGAVVNVYAKWTNKAITLPTPTRTGYVFDGWYTTATGGTKIGGGGSSYTTDKDITVYAHWTPITYTIKFDGNKATSGTMSSMSMTYDVAKNLTVNAYARTGYTFTGWNTAADGKGTAYSDKQSVKNLTATDKATITLYAQWKPISYTIRFNSNGGTGTMSDLAMTYDVAKNLTANAFVKNGAEFIKWNTKADGMGTDYSDKQVVKNLTTENGKVITLYAQWKNTRELSLEAITPNAAYRESTDVITSFNLVNKGEGACLPTGNVSVVFKVYKDSTVIKTVTQTNVIVPGNEKNLLFFKWTVPSNLGSSKIYVSAEIVENGASYGLVKNSYTTCKYDVYSTPDTQYEASAPDGFVVPEVPTAKSDTAKWSVWTYENNAFKKLNYGMTISDAAATITPDESANAEQKNGGWVMKSGYGYGISQNNGIKTLSGYTAAPAAAYTNVQYALALFPEFGYANTADKCRTLELVSGKWIFRENSDYGRLHFTPLWFPDGPYTATVLQSDCWTPAGMISRMSNTNTITISGSAYDDWFIG